MRRILSLRNFKPKRVLTRQKSRSIERAARNDNISQLLIWLLLTLTGAAGVLALRYTSRIHPELHGYIDSALLTFFLSVSLYLLYRIATFDQIARMLNYSIHELRDDVAEIALWERKRSRLKRIGQAMVVDAGTELMRDYLEMLDVSDSTLTLRDTKWSLHFNSIFWRHLISYSHRVGGGVVVLVTHTSGVEMWRGKAAEASLKQQAQFIREGGNKIVRMFIHRTNKASAGIPRGYRDIMAEMTDTYGIETCYIAPRENPPEAMPDATFVTKLGIFMTWVGGGADEFRIGSLQSELARFKEQWPILFARSVKLDGTSPILSEAVVSELNPDF